MQGQLEVLDVETAMRLLREHHFGRLALNDSGGPLIFPVNYVYDGGAIVFRSDLGTKLYAAEDRDAASFEIDHVDLDLRIGWSVLVRGRLEEAIDAIDLAHLDGVGVDPIATGEGKRHVVRLLPRVITGRRVPLPEDVAEGFYRAAVEDSAAFDR